MGESMSKRYVAFDSAGNLIAEADDLDELYNAITAIYDAEDYSWLEIYDYKENREIDPCSILPCIEW